MIKIRKERREIISDTAEIKKKTIREYYANKLENLEETDKFIETYSSPKLNQEDINNLNRPTTKNEIESVIKEKIPCKQKSRMGWLH